MHFLVDTGCPTTYCLYRCLTKLSERVRNSLEESDSHGIMADGTQLPLYGILRLPLRVRDVKTEKVFVSSHIKDAILGMPFLVTQSCSMEFSQSKMHVDGKRLKCTDRHGQQLVGSVQASLELVVQTNGERKLSRTTSRPVGYGDYECYPCTIGWKNEEIEADPVQACGETTPNSIAGTKPAHSRPRTPPIWVIFQTEECLNEIQEMREDRVDGDTNIVELSDQKRPDLLNQRRDT